MHGRSVPGRLHPRVPGAFTPVSSAGSSIRWDTLLEQGSWTVAREAGLVRSEGKDYHPVDGDVMEFRFNV